MLRLLPIHRRGVATARALVLIGCVVMLTGCARDSAPDPSLRLNEFGPLAYVYAHDLAWLLTCDDPTAGAKPSRAARSGVVGCVDAAQKSDLRVPIAGKTVVQVRGMTLRWMADTGTNSGAVGACGHILHRLQLRHITADETLEPCSSRFLPADV